MKQTDQIIARLSRIKGQIEGISRMYQDGRECIAIVQQVVAARNSLNSVARQLLSSEATRCNREKRWQDLDAVLKEVFRT